MAAWLAGVWASGAWAVGAWEGMDEGGAWASSWRAARKRVAGCGAGRLLSR